MTSWFLRQRGGVAVLGMVLALGLAQPQSAHALDRDVKAVLTTGAWGILGGTVLGLAAYPFTKDVKKIFVGSSIGLYLGIAVGIYFVYNRYDPENPLHMQHEPPPPWEQRRAPQPGYDGGGPDSRNWESPGHKNCSSPLHCSRDVTLWQGQFEVARF